MHRLATLLLATLALIAPDARALDAATLAKLAADDTDDRIAAIQAIVEAPGARGETILRAMSAGELYAAAERVLIVRDGKAVDALTGAGVDPMPQGAEEITLNNRLRRTLGPAVAALGLSSPDRARRLAAARELDGADEALLPMVARALAREKDPEVRSLLALIEATAGLQSRDRERRLAAVRTLAGSDNAATRQLLLPLLEKRPDGTWAEPDEPLRIEVQRSLREIESRLAWGERAALLFAGVSLGSILLLAALGLAITYGLMGVINMAHGELIMIGAYATYVVQSVFRTHLPEAVDWYPLVAVPAAFASAAAVGMLLERTVIRHLYGRPLETLLATWGISLVLMQSVRSAFGAQNVQVENPSWMSGGIEIMANVVLPWNRVVIIGFAAAVVVAVWLVLTRTRLGLFVRGVTQNRPMASCLGVPTARIDMWAFGLGAGVAGLAGCALSQIGNVGPDLGQAYIVDSFMVVVLGGVGQLAGTIYAAMGLGMVNKLLESWSGAVIAKIAVLVFIILFIQKRPQGIFALKGRAVEG